MSSPTAGANGFVPVRLDRHQVCACIRWAPSAVHVGVCIGPLPPDDETTATRCAVAVYSSEHRCAGPHVIVHGHLWR